MMTPGMLTESEANFYKKVASADAHRTEIANIYIPKETGKAFRVEKGHILRITCCEGPQVADFNAFSADDPAEFFWSGRTRTLQGGHLTIGDRLWSTEPNMRPMFTIIEDTIDHKPLPHNAASHDLIYARCSEGLWALRLGHKGAPNCNTNLKRALEEIGFSSDYVHDAFNVFMTTGIDEKQRLFYLEPDAKKGDYIELYAEIDTIVAISCCPGGCNGPENKGLQCTIFDHGLAT